MQAAPIPVDDVERLAVLHELDVLDTPAEVEFDALVRAASLVCGAPISLISLVDTERQWFKANVGLPGVSETPRDVAFCAHTIGGDELFEVADASLDARFADNPLVTGQPDIRFYAGAPLRLSNGSRVGTLCVIDRRARQLNNKQREILRSLASVAASALESRRAVRIHKQAIAQLARAETILEHSADAIIGLSIAGKVVRVNHAAEQLFGYSAKEMADANVSFLGLVHGDEAPEIQAILAPLGEGGAKTYDSEFKHRNGELIPVSVTVVPELGPDGQLIGATKFIRDSRAQEQAKTELEASEARFRSLSDSSPHGVFYTDVNGSCTYTNRRFQEIFGLNLATGLGHDWTDSLRPTERMAVRHEWQRAAAEQAEFDMEFKIRRGDGTVRQLHARARPMLDANDRTVGYVGSVEDITERQTTLARLAASEDRQRRLYEATPAMLHSIDAQGRLLTVSDAWLAKLGYQRDEVIGRQTYDFLTPTSSQYAREQVLPIFFATGRCDDVEYQMVCKNGQIIDVMLSATLERDQAGHPLRSLAVIEDVTLRRQTERALQEKSQRLAHIIDGTHAGTWEWNVPTGEARFNERWAEMIGLTLSELSSHSIQTWREYMHPDDLEGVNIELNRHFNGECSRYECEFRMRHRSGEWIWVLAIGQVMTWTTDGKPSWMFGTHQDISLRKKQEEALRTNREFLDRAGRLAGIGGWEFDLTNDQIVFSDETCRIHGLPPGSSPEFDEAIQFYAPEARPVIQSAVEQAIDDGTPFDMELPFDRADGTRIWVRVVGSADFEAGKAVRLIGALQDVSERVAEQLALENANERVSLATDSGKIGIWDWDLTSNALIWDSWMYRLYGLEPDNTTATYDLWSERIHPDDLAAAEREVQDAIVGSKPFEYEFRVVWPDGSVHCLRGSARVTRDAAGRALRMVGTNWDITESRQLATALADQHELLRVTLRSIGDAVITTDANGDVVWLNPVAERMTGWLIAEAVGRPLTKVFHIVNEETRQPTENPVMTCLEQGKVVGLANHTLLISRDGDEFGIEDSAAPIRNEQGALLGVVLVFHDVTEQRRLSGEMSYRASHDALTGLVNRAEFETRLRRVLQKAHEDRSQHALMYIDLDQFKLVNDACGHTIGDQLLQQVGKLLSDTVRTRDTLARLGGDEFGIILEHCTTDQAQRVGQQICEKMDDYRFIHDERRFRIGTSIGLVPVDSRWSTTAAILKAADTSCYAAKEGGRNRVHVWFDTDIAMRTRHGEMQWATRIEQALDEDRFVLFAQRIGALNQEPHGTHAEALLRMVEVDGTLVQPGAFLPAAERFHLASRIDRWVLKRAIAWMKALPPRVDIDTLCINLSGHSIGDRTFHRWATAVLKEAGPKICGKLCLEITETAAVMNLGDAAIFIEEVRAAGVKVALDDFGAGASSFGYLKTMPVDYLKIDGQFIRDLVDDPLDEAAVRCFADVAKVVGVKTVAEFVDRPEILDRLRLMGIDFAQGFYVHRPAPIDELMLEAA